jgi:hypothetical protein
MWTSSRNMTAHKRKKLYTVMYEFDLAPKLVRLVRVIMTGTEAQGKM